MNKDFSEYQPLIDSFAGLTNKSSFDTKYKAATMELSKTERFLLKMELKRLASPCTRCLDFRGLVDGECQLFDFQGQNHFLDDFTIQVFQENAELYQGYTFGVYEAVKNAVSNLRHVQQVEKFNAESIDDKQYSKKGLTGKKNQYSVKLFSFESYPNRIEERMNFAVPVTVALNDAQKIEVTSIDISLTGLKIKVTNQTDFFEGDRVTVIFTGLEQEFKFNSNYLFIYQVQNILNDNDVQFIGLKRINIKENDSFVRFLANYIQGNKRRYKINLDNSINALQARSFEQFSLSKINELVIFMSGNNQSFLPRYVLSTKNNQSIYNYWRNEKKDSTLNFLVNSKRFDRLKVAQKQGRSLIVFSFIHIYQGLQYFYSIDDLQQADDELFFSNFIAFAADKESFKVTSLSYNEVSTEQAYSPYTTVNLENKKEENLNRPLSTEIKEALNKLSTIVTAVDLTNDMRVEDYKSLSHKGINLTKLKLFGHKRLNQPIVVDEILVNYDKQRQEHRFVFKTPVIIECQSVHWTGISIDFSVSGLQLELDKPAILVSGDIVNLTFPNLQKITSKFTLKALPYKVVRTNKDKTIVNLRVLIKDHKHIGRSFFKLLIDKNKEKLTPDEYAILSPDLSSALRTMYAANLSIPTAIVQTSGSRYKVGAMVIGANDNAVNNSLLDAMSDPLGDQSSYNLHPLLNGFPISSLLEQELKKISSNGMSVCELIYITVNSDIEDIESAISVQLASEFNTSELTQTFIRESLVRGKFYCIEARISNSEKPKMEHLHPELNYIGLYAIHRGKQLEDEIDSVVGVVELFDATQEALLRNKLIELN